MVRCLPLELLAGFGSVLIAIVASTTTLAYWLGKKFTRIDARFDRIEGRLRALASAVLEAHHVVVDFLSLKGLIEKKEADYLKDRIGGLFKSKEHSSMNHLEKQGNEEVKSLRVDPPASLRKEDAEFLRDFFERDLERLTVEEAEKAYELGKRLFVEHADERGFLVAIAAAYIKGYLSRPKSPT
jgi:Flp pilus assembly pilin Flp